MRAPPTTLKPRHFPGHLNTCQEQKGAQYAIRTSILPVRQFLQVSPVKLTRAGNNPDSSVK
ncbi:hypothetical protein E2C01_071717 [Portunus trituberculatus]|uniref:Uncharacterized protein n=1 Tax=Portunus trituberculatus TaxID=210409 RepID=A0A5B7I5S5_PORTR|nr:hypothetical protein [Portunus trituberculatus]